MRKPLIIAFVLLGALAAGSLLYATLLGKKVNALTARLDELERTRPAPRPGIELAVRPRAPDAPPSSPSAPADPAQPAPPPASTSVLPPPFDDADALEQLRRFIGDEIARQRGGVSAAVTAQKQEQLVATATKELGLSADEKSKVATILAEAQAARAAYFEDIKTGKAPKSDISARMTTLRNESQERLRKALGEERYKRFVEIQRKEDAGPQPPP